jgi:hypothetical protein
VNKRAENDSNLDLPYIHQGGSASISLHLGCADEGQPSFCQLTPNFRGVANVGRRASWDEKQNGTGGNPLGQQVRRFMHIKKPSMASFNIAN